MTRHMLVQTYVRSEAHRSRWIMVHNSRLCTALLRSFHLPVHSLSQCGIINLCITDRFIDEFIDCQFGTCLNNLFVEQILNKVLVIHHPGRHTQSVAYHFSATNWSTTGCTIIVLTHETSIPRCFEIMILNHMHASIQKCCDLNRSCTLASQGSP